MACQIITTANAPSSPLYSQGAKAGPHVLVSGIVSIDPSTGSLAGDTIQDQTRQALWLMSMWRLTAAAMVASSFRRS